MSRSNRINQVLEQRRPLSERVKNVDQGIIKLESRIITFKEGCGRASNLSAVRKKSTLQSIQNQCDTLLSSIAAFRERTRPLRSRLERSTINIGVFGPIGAGKSTLLQAITELDGSIIPATGGTGSFTSTKSIIEHSKSAAEAHVTFYTEQELLAEVLRPFLLRISATRDASIESLDEFFSFALPDDAPSEERSSLLELKKYQDPKRASEYRQFLDRPPVKLKSLKEVGRFLTYWAHDPADTRSAIAKRRPPSTEQSLWMATRQVKIKCNFKADDVGEIALIDMPGFGDKQAGHEERLVRALEDDVDLALYVYKPGPHRDGWEKSDTVKHFQIAKRAMNGQLPLKDWSFIVLNHLQSKDPSLDTYEICNEMAEKMYAEGIDVHSALICDVTDHRAVRQRILDPILNYLSENIARMDLHFAQELQRDAFALQASLSRSVEELRSQFNIVFEDTDEAELLSRKSTELWEQLKVQLVSSLYYCVWPAREKDDEKYLELVNQCIEKASDAKADTAALKSLALDGSTKQAAMHLLHNIRIDVMSSLQPIYRSPFKAVELLKKEVTEILCSSGGFGRLGRVDSAPDRLAEISQVLRRLKGCRRLAEAVDLVREFDTSSGVLLPEIRKHLAKLDPEFATPEEHKTLDVPGEPVAEDKLSKTASALDSLRKDVVAAIGKSLLEKQKTPSQTAAYLLFEFVDRTIRDNAAVGEWRKVHNQLREELWPREFNGLAEAKLVEQSVESALDAFELECEPVHFRFAVT